MLATCFCWQCCVMALECKWCPCCAADAGLPHTHTHTQRCLLCARMVCRKKRLKSFYTEFSKFTSCYMCVCPQLHSFFFYCSFMNGPIHTHTGLASLEWILTAPSYFQRLIATKCFETNRNWSSTVRKRILRFQRHHPIVISLNNWSAMIFVGTLNSW